jgi:hypothetical protein
MAALTQLVSSKEKKIKHGLCRQANMVKRTLIFKIIHAASIETVCIEIVFLSPLAGCRG